MRGIARKRDGFVESPSPGQGVPNPRHRQYRRPDHKFVRQPQNPKPLRLQPDIARSVGDDLLSIFVTRSVDLDDEPALETNEIDDVALQRNLALKFGAVASAIAHRAPDERLGLNVLGALLAREAPHYGSRDFIRHLATLAGNSRALNVRSRRAARDPPHPAGSAGHLPPRGARLSGETKTRTRREPTLDPHNLRASCPALCRASTSRRRRQSRKFLAAPPRGWPGQAP